MSGHSKFSNIKHKKEKNDAAKGKIFTKLGRELAVAGVICGAIVANLLHWGIASINGMVVASIIYIIGRKASGKKA